MPKKPIYTDLAKYYDLIYSHKDYQHEANQIKSLIKKYKKSNDNDLLEVACGTGKHIQYFKDSFSILATDANKDMLAVAQKNIPSVKFKQADMIHLDLDKKFDVIICLFSSIGYVKNYKNLNKTIKNFAQHLKIGGVVIIEPWLAELSFITGAPSMATYNGNDIKIARLCISKKQGMLSILDLHYLIAEQNKEIKSFVEHHELAMFEPNKVLNIMKEKGLKAIFLKNGLMKDRGLYIGVKNR